MRIVFGTDGSETAQAAARFLAALPLPAGSDVLLVSGSDLVTHPSQLRSLGSDDRVRAEAALDAHDAALDDLLAAEAAQLHGAGLEVETGLRTGHPAAVIADAAQERNAELVVVGSHGLRGFRRFVLGSVSRQVLHDAACSVLIVPGPDTDEDRDGVASPTAPVGRPWRILIAFDGSEPSRRAVALCTRLALGEQDVVHLLTVLPVVRAYRQDIIQALDPVWQQQKAEARSSLDEAAEELRAHGVSVTTSLTAAEDVGDGILAAAREFEADLVVVGNKGAGPIQNFLTGSVTPVVAGHARRAVLAVR